MFTSSLTFHRVEEAWWRRLGQAPEVTDLILDSLPDCIKCWLPPILRHILNPDWREDEDSEAKIVTHQNKQQIGRSDRRGATWPIELTFLRPLGPEDGGSCPHDPLVAPPHVVGGGLRGGAPPPPPRCRRGRGLPEADRRRLRPAWGGRLLPGGGLSVGAPRSPRRRRGGELGCA
jgi:hypothetical protein